MGQSKESGGVGGWIPYHPAVARAIAGRIPAYRQNLAPVCALFLTVCWQMRGRSTLPGLGLWFEKTRGQWSETLGVSMRIVDHIYGLMCVDDGTGQKLPGAQTCLGLVRKQLGGYRNAGLFLMDLEAANQFWLANGPQPALTDGAEVVTPTKRQVVTPTKRQVVTPTKRQVVTPTLQPHTNNMENNMENHHKAAAVALLGVYGLTRADVKESVAEHLGAREDADLLIFLHGELTNIEVDKRAGTPRAIASPAGWLCEVLRKLDPQAAPALTMAEVDKQLDAAEASAYEAHGRRPAEMDEPATTARRQRRQLFFATTGRVDERPDPVAEAERRNAEVIAKFERRRAEKEAKAV